MLLEDKWLKKVNSSAVEQVEGRTFAKCNQKTYSNNHELFQKFQSYCPCCGSKRLWNSTLKKAIPPFSFHSHALKGSWGLVPNFTTCSFNPIVQRVGTLHKRVTSDPRLYIFCVSIITGKLTSISMDVSKDRIKPFWVTFF